MIKIENRCGVAKRPSAPVSAMIVEPRRIGFAQTPVRKDQEACASVEVVGSAVWGPLIGGRELRTGGQSEAFLALHLQTGR
jgi:hypothetical protein